MPSCKLGHEKIPDLCTRDEALQWLGVRFKIRFGSGKVISRLLEELVR